MTTATTATPAELRDLALALLTSAPGPLTAARIASMADAITVDDVQGELDTMLAAGMLRRGVTKQSESGYTLATR